MFHILPYLKQESIELYKWKCPECIEGHCEIVNLSEDFEKEFIKLDSEIMLEPVELDIIETLKTEKKKMRAGEISALIDKSYQLIGKRTGKLQEMGLVDKERNSKDKTTNKITQRAINTYFGDE